jgi:hypothetical protein
MLARLADTPKTALGKDRIRLTNHADGAIDEFRRLVSGYPSARGGERSYWIFRFIYKDTQPL